MQRGPVLIKERLHLDLERFLGHFERRPPGSHGHDGSIATTQCQFQPAPRASSLPAGAAVASWPRSQERRTTPVSVRPA